MLFLDLVWCFLAEVDSSGDEELDRLVGWSFVEGGRFWSASGRGPYFFALFVIVLVSDRRMSRMPSG